MNIAQLDLVNDDIFTILGIEDLPDDEKQSMLTTMLETIQGRVVARLLDALTEEERVQVEKYFDESNTEAINALLQAKGIDGLSSLMAQESMIYKLELAQIVAEPEVAAV